MYVGYRGEKYVLFASWRIKISPSKNRCSSLAVTAFRQTELLPNISIDYKNHIIFQRSNTDILSENFVKSICDKLKLAVSCFYLVKVEIYALSTITNRRQYAAALCTFTTGYVIDWLKLGENLATSITLSTW